jgi:hypothetical protein
MGSGVLSCSQTTARTERKINDSFVCNTFKVTDYLEKLTASMYETRTKAMLDLIGYCKNLNTDELKVFIQALNDFKQSKSDAEVNIRINEIFARIVKLQLENRFNTAYNKDKFIDINDLSEMTMITHSINEGEEIYKQQETAVKKLHEKFGEKVLDDLLEILKVGQDTKLDFEFAYKGVFRAIASLSKNEKTLKELSKTESIKLRIALVSNESLNEELRNELLQKKINAEELKWHLVKNNDPIPEKLLCKLFQDEDVEFKKFLICCYLIEKPENVVEDFEKYQKNQDLSPETITNIQESLLKSKNILLLKCTSNTKFQTPNFLHKLAKLNNQDLNYWIADNVQLPESVDLIIRNELKRITGNENGDVFNLPEELRILIVSNPNITKETLARFVDDPSDRVKSLLVKQINKLSPSIIDRILRNEKKPIEVKDPKENQSKIVNVNIPSSKRQIIRLYQLSKEQFDYIRCNHRDLITDLLEYQKLSDNQFKEFLLSGNSDWRDAICRNQNLTDEQLEHLFNFQKFVRNHIDDKKKQYELEMTQVSEPILDSDQLIQIKTQDLILMNLTVRSNLSKDQIDQLVKSTNKQVKFYMALRDNLSLENIEHLIKTGDSRTLEKIIEKQKLTDDQLDYLISLNQPSINKQLIRYKDKNLLQYQINELVANAIESNDIDVLGLICINLNLSEKDSFDIINRYPRNNVFLESIASRTNHQEIIRLFESSLVESVRGELLTNPNLSTASFDRVLRSLTNPNLPLIPIERASFMQLQKMKLNVKN